MPAAGRRTIHIVSHGPSCLDGVVAAATVARFYEGHRVIPHLTANADADRRIRRLRPRAGAGEPEEIWITDLSWNSTETGEHLRALAQKGVAIYWFDHHRTAVSRANAPEFKVPFRAKVLSERYCAARLTYNFLIRRGAKLGGSAAGRKALKRFYPLVEIADDNDRWLKRLPASGEWALAVQTLGGAEALREIMKMEEPMMTPRLSAALQEGRKALARSLALGRASMVERTLPNGLRLRSACCYGYSSEVAAELYQGQRQTVIALFDLRSQGVSLRRSADCKVDLSQTARLFGGGGHAAAAGFTIPDISRYPAEKLAAIVGEQLKTLPSPD